MANQSYNLQPSRFPLLTLLHPREQSGLVSLALVLGLALSWLGVQHYGWPLWGAAAMVLVALFIPLTFKWRTDLHHYGQIGLGISFLLTTQGFHAIEHLVQWVQYHLLNWSMRQSSGVLSPANSEWVHFIWNWLVVIVVVVLVKLGWRNGWAWLLLIWSLAHASEHTYMFIRYQLVLNELEQLGFTTLTAQGLPGVLGRGGWLAQSALTRSTFWCRLPGLTTAVRLDIHFWWNIGETALLLLASHTYLRRTWPSLVQP